MKLESFYDALSKCLILFCGLCLIMSCSADEELQPAQLIKVTSYNHFRDITYQHLPKGDADVILAVHDLIELVFDKPVLKVSINYSAKAQPDEMPPTTIWKMESNRLEDVWNLQIGWNPVRDVTLMVIYEDETGIHKDTLDVTLGAYSIDVFPPFITFSNPWHNEVNADAVRLNREGIKIGFDKEMDNRPSRTQIEVYNDQEMLNWSIDCWTLPNDDEYGVHMVTLLPESEGDRLLPGQQYEVHLVDFYDYKGTRGEGLEDGPIVIKFQTASEEQ